MHQAAWSLHESRSEYCYEYYPIFGFNHGHLTKPYGLTMVYYIRFLKPPRIVTGKKRKATVKFVITITTDLGDSFFPEDIELVSSLVDSHYKIEGLGSTNSQWRNGMRSVNAAIEIVNHPEINWPIRLYTHAGGVKQSVPLSQDDIQAIVQVSSDDINLSTNREVRRRVERSFCTTNGPDLSIWEDTGESIARHVWDAGVALAGYFQKTPQQVAQNLLFSQLQHVCSQAKRPRVIELGSGCGIVGIGLAQRLPRADFVLTDLPEAMEILEHNISKARPAKSTTLRADTLNWDQPIPMHLLEAPSNLILVSDCTYNSDSIPGLVRTMSALTARSPSALIIVAMKVRHSSEAVFFDLMKGAGLAIEDNFAVPLPSPCSPEDQEPETIEIHVFKSAAPPS